MKKNLTELVFILDRSGSMSNLVDETIGGFNSMIEKYKTELEEAYITTVLFDHNYELLHDHINIKNISSVTEKDYYARGMTALHDAVGRTIDEVGVRLAATPEENRPEKVIFVIVTDGYENASKEYSKTKVKEMIEHQRTKYSWEFMFLGANIDAESTAESIGISKDYAATYAASTRGVNSVYEVVGEITSCMACCDFAMDAASVKAILNDKIVSDNNTMASAVDSLAGDDTSIDTLCSTKAVNSTCNTDAIKSSIEDIWSILKEKE